MKKLFISIAAAVIIALTVSACSSAGGSQNDYFGYNKPDADEFYKEENSAERTTNSAAQPSNVKAADREWQNPLAEDYAGGASYDKAAYNPDVHVQYNYVNPMYVPVIVPWWDRYYGWVSYPRRGFYVYVGSGYYGSYYGTYWGGYYGGYYAYDWYNPWYAYHPYHGYSWRHYHYPVHYSWWNQPVYSHHPAKTSVRKRSVRTWGPSRGNVYDYGRSGTGGSTGTRSSSRTGYTSSSSRGSIEAVTPVSGRPSRSAVRTTSSPSGNSSPVRTGSVETGAVKGMNTWNNNTYTQPQSFDTRPELKTIYESPASTNTRSSSKSYRSSGAERSGKSYRPTRSSSSGKSSGSSYSRPSSSGSSRSTGVRSSGSSSRSSGSSSSGSSSSGSSSSGSSSSGSSGSRSSKRTR